MVYTKYTFFHGYFFKIGKKKTGNWRFSKLKGKKRVIGVPICTHSTHEKTCIWCTPSICCEIRKIGQHQIGVKIISEGNSYDAVFHCFHVSSLQGIVEVAGRD